jgi:hypothetical protein
LLPILFPLPEEGGSQHLLVTVWFGANDAAAPTEVTHIPLPEFTDNLRAILLHLQKVSTTVVVITPPPVHGPTRLAFQRRKYGDGASGTLERTTESAGRYAVAARQVAGELGVPVFDAHQRMLEQPDWPRFVGSDGLGDGLHLAAAGQRFIGAGLVPWLASERVMGISIDPSAAPQQRLLSEVEGLPIDLPAGAKIRESEAFPRYVSDHLAKHAACRNRSVIAAESEAA